MKNLVTKSYAKINICLDITGKKDDGYHTLDMVMVPIELHDTILISELKNGVDHFVTIDDFSYGNVHYNLATFALDKLSAKTGFKNKFRISIHKVTPIQAGLGGGSSNAAFTLKAVKKYLNLQISDDELVELAKPLGADIPFFIKCKPSRCRGIGEILEPIEIKNNYHVLLVKPEKGCSTKDVFDIADNLTLKTGSVENVIKALKEGDDELLAASMFNALEEPAFSLLPEIKEIKNALLEEGLKMVQMSGSGSTVFAISTDKKALKRAAKKLEDKYFVELTKIVK